MPPRRVPQDDDRLTVLFDEDWGEGARLAEWRGVLERVRHLPLVLRAALAHDAWNDIEMLQRDDWVGPLLVAALMRQEGLAPIIYHACIWRPKSPARAPSRPRPDPAPAGLDTGRRAPG